MPIVYTKKIKRVSLLNIKKSIHITLSFLVMSPILLYLYHIFESNTAMQHFSRCESNLRQLGREMSLYMEDWNETLPPAKTWQVSIISRFPNENKNSIFICPSSPQKYGYSYNSKCDHLLLSDVPNPSSKIWLYEQNSSKSNGFGDGNALPPLYRHFKRSNFLHVDGHVSWISIVSKSKLSW